MRIDIITLLPELLEGPFQHSILKRANEKGLLTVTCHNLRQYSTYAHKQVDDYAYGGGAGMVMMMEPIVNCIEQLKLQYAYDDIIYMSPDGELLNQPLCNYLSLKENLLVLCGHYKGIDERVRQHFITREISIGDYVLSGGELAAAVLVDALGRLIPGVLNNETSALDDSFQNDLIAPPVYTRPEVFRGLEVPEILLSGNHVKIEAWRFEQSLERTKQRRPSIYKTWKND
ncbi:MAG: tRNA (guanosine(37)-N1)-methyltransferase TrmD [Sphingobacteriales bacterium]|jgi:tRNA (guanine37-N1)-methyltransferase|nr:tRNA (guanosine(37)-N1)-methyltransferase TrmD [Sphingobacteriales bacterium]MBP9142130.1 tRNA (guanosine(37)-N1)-methyltransferase TrmD [Chitinophagales bacterium]MDA0198642.1 tRNA (guanosine(37)-N1)-methyltransferase TrmD [Bacteroidota bacterium]MBK6890691.1 tRNA (guanosine(37)-N1)-methyltransferase TrmD [Sphingobacteriales bacterium]MBK7526256.1 tRNA (guanosine(37)-N1)-methyltransferase TrmD [Sphingobacteriales bacterium]